MRIFAEYLKSKRKLLIMLIIFVIIFASVFFLYDLPVEAIGYASLLCLFILGIFGVYGYIKFLKKHKRLVKLQSDIAIRQNSFLRH